MIKYNAQDKHSIQNLFNLIASKYDIVNNFMSLGLQKQIKKIAVKKALKKLTKIPNDILDLCTGTGDVAILLQKSCPHANIMGMDFSDNMLNIAKMRNKQIKFIKQDITKLEKTNEQYDLCFISFGLRNLPNIDEFLNDIKPFLRTGGILSILDLGKPIKIMKPYFFFHYNFLIPFIAKCMGLDVKPYQYLIESAKTYPSQKEIINKLAQHGFTSAENYNYAFGIISQQIATKN